MKSEGFRNWSHRQLKGHLIKYCVSVLLANSNLTSCQALGLCVQNDPKSLVTSNFTFTELGWQAPSHTLASTHFVHQLMQ